MSFVNFAKREVILKIVFYGAAECGKTTNLLFLHQTVQDKYRGDIVILDTKGERTLFFDFFPIYLGEVQGFKIKFQLYTVPGQSYYSASRRLVLDGTDGVIFVIDSQQHREHENFESWNDMMENLAFFRIDPAKLPIVLQYNKRDLTDLLELGSFERHLKLSGHSVFEAVATNGNGVFASIKDVSKQVIQRFQFGG